MSPYLTFKIISVAILMVVMVVVLISKKSDKATVKESDDTQKNTDAIANEIKHKEWYLSDFAKAVFFDDSKSSDIEKKEWAVIFYKRFSPDGHNAYLNILQWFEENNIGVSHWSNNILYRHAHPRCSDDFDAEDLIGGEYKVTEVQTVK